MADGATSPEDLLKSYTSSVISGDVAKENEELFKKKKKERATSFSRPPVVPKKTGVFKPGNWFRKGNVSRGAEIEQEQH